jgi:hypothetical protein
MEEPKDLEEGSFEGREDVGEDGALREEGSFGEIERVGFQQKPSPPASGAGRVDQQPMEDEAVGSIQERDQTEDVGEMGVTGSESESLPGAASGETGEFGTSESETSGSMPDSATGTITGDEAGSTAGDAGTMDRGAEESIRGGAAGSLEGSAGGTMSGEASGTVTPGTRTTR